MWISGALFKQKIFFWTKGGLLYKNLLKRSVLIIHVIWTRKTDFFSVHTKTTSNSRRNKKWIKYTFIKIGANEHTLFYIKNAFFSIQLQRCLTFSWIKVQMLLRCCLIHITIIIQRILIFAISLDLGLFMLCLCGLIFIFI